MKNVVYNSDCLPAMRKMKDNEFDLAIVDPPYGLGLKFSTKEQKKWNANVPTMEYFNELIRVSKEQIIWGINYYPKMSNDKGGRIVWYKEPTFNNKMKISDCEIALYSKHKRIAFFHYQYYGNVENGSIDWQGIDRIHPTQKPITLYKWLLKNYAKEEDTILDTHVGSGSSRIACYEMGFSFVGYEIDVDYWKAQEKRFNIVKNQMKLF